jgi:hypothetical protein
MTQEGSTRAGDPTGLAHLLTTAAAGDTLMRDLYLARARSALEPICSETRYRAALGDRATVDRLLTQSRAAVGPQDWKQVEELAGRAAQLRRGLEGEQAGLAARYGGTADLCGISSSDARDNVVTRFAVVRRERLATGLV